MDEPVHSAAPSLGVPQTLRVDPVGFRANALLVPPIIVGFLSIGDGALGLAIGLTSAASLGLGAWLLRGGLRAEMVYHGRALANPPALPRKFGAAVFAGLGTALAAWRVDPSLSAAILFGAVACALHIAAFGLDPMKSKGASNLGEMQADRVRRVVIEAEATLENMSKMLARLGDRDVDSAFAAFYQTAQALIQAVARNPRDLPSARKYLGVYLRGAQDATAKFVDLRGYSSDPLSRAAYCALLSDLDQNFAARARALFSDPRDLTIEIEVLRERLQREGVPRASDHTA